MDSLVNKMEQIRNAEISEAISTAAQIIGAIEEFTVEMWLDYYDVFDLAVEKWSKPHKRTLLHDYIEAVYLEGQNYTLDKHFPGPVIKELKNILNAYNVDYSSVVETEHIEIYEDGCGNDEAEEYAGALQTFFIDNVLNRFIDDIFKTPIEAAKKKYEESELKDAASKCRQAMESVSYNLWNKISNTSNGEISVAMRSPKSQPDLFSIVNALIKKTKKIQGMESITEKLEAIKEQDNWRVLNKGTHFEDEQSEFERADVKNVLDILTALDDSVRELKIQETAVV